MPAITDSKARESWHWSAAVTREIGRQQLIGGEVKFDDDAAAGAPERLWIEASVRCRVIQRCPVCPAQVLARTSASTSRGGQQPGPGGMLV
jgi:hypothetical protein